MPLDLDKWKIWYLTKALHRSQLNDAILEGGIPFNRTYGTHAFKYLDSDPRFNKVFNAAMFNHTTIVIKKILESYKGFEQLRQLVDVGGGLGVTINLITTRYDNIKGINFDLPHVIYNMLHLFLVLFQFIIFIFQVSPCFTKLKLDWFSKKRKS